LHPEPETWVIQAFAMPYSRIYDAKSCEIYTYTSSCPMTSHSVKLPTRFASAGLYLNIPKLLSGDWQNKYVVHSQHMIAQSIFLLPVDRTIGTEMPVRAVSIYPFRTARRTVSSPASNIPHRHLGSLSWDFLWQTNKPFDSNLISYEKYNVLIL
jgi:hypothetical protein